MAEESGNDDVNEAKGGPQKEGGGGKATTDQQQQHQVGPPVAEEEEMNNDDQAPRGDLQSSVGGAVEASPTATAAEEEEEVLAAMDDEENNILAKSSTPSPQTPVPLFSDPISESYRSIVEVINRTSNGFKEGKKWKCSGSTGGGGSGGYHQQQKNKKIRHSHTIDERYFELSDPQGHQQQQKRDPAASGGGLNRGAAARGRRLVRQKVIENDDEEQQGLLSSSSSAHVVTTAEVTRAPISSNNKRFQKQWTVDTCSALKSSQHQQQHEAFGQAYLLRPVSRGSIVSSSGAIELAEIKKVSPVGSLRGFNNRSPVPVAGNRAIVATAADVASVSSASITAGKINERVSNPQVVKTNRKLIKQRTSESAPQATGGGQGGGTASGGGRSRLPRQCSNASAYSAVLPGSSLGSHQGITLVRGASCSLVDIPTYLGGSQAAVELAQRCEVVACDADPTQLRATTLPSNKRPRLQLDLTKKNKSLNPEEGDDGEDSKSAARKTQWTVLCVSLTLLTLSVTLVGTMLSLGSQYQDRMFAAKRWDSFRKNGTSVGIGVGGGLREPFVIFPEVMEDEDEDDVDQELGNGTTSSRPPLSPPIVPIIFPDIGDTKRLLGLDVDVKDEADDDDGDGLGDDQGEEEDDTGDGEGSNT